MDEKLCYLHTYLWKRMYTLFIYLLIKRYVYIYVLHVCYAYEYYKDYLCPFYVMYIHNLTPFLRVLGTQQCKINGMDGYEKWGFYAHFLL